jgi:hypothetical protein
MRQCRTLHSHFCQQSAAKKVWESASDNLKENIIFLFTKYYYGDRIEKDKMGGDCSKHGRRGKFKPVGIPSVDVLIVLEWVLKEFNINMGLDSFGSSSAAGPCEGGGFGDLMNDRL